MNEKKFGEAPAHLQRTARGSLGHITVVGPTGIVDEGDTLMCVHCQKHWIIQPGSGIKRGFCMRCNGVTCGGAKCDTCIPFEKKLEIAEGRDPNRTQF